MAKQVDLDTVSSAILKVNTFLKPFLALANTHGAEFLSDSHWDKFFSKPVQDVLTLMDNDDLVRLSLLSLNGGRQNNAPDVTDTAEKAKNDPFDARVKDLGLFISEAQNCQLPQLGVLTPVDAALGTDTQDSGSQHGSFVISEAMSKKKVHEVGIMVDAVSTLFKSTSSDVVVDVGSGKGYFASELSHKNKVPVVGFDSSDTNTHGAARRDKSLVKKWSGLERRTKRKQVNKKINTEIGLEEDKGRSVEPGVTLFESRVQHSSAGDAPQTGRPKHVPVQDNVSQDFISLGSPSKKLCSPERTLDCSLTNSDKRLNSTLTTADSAKATTDAKECSEHGGHKDGGDLYVPVTLYVSPEVDLLKVIQESAPHHLTGRATQSLPRLFLSGLHTCGSLAVTTQHLFLENPHATAMCCVGCCYQLMDEQTNCPSQTTHQFPLSSYGKSLGLQLGRNARNLASQSVHRTSRSGQLQGGEFLWRALLNVLFLELGLLVPEKIQGMRGLNKKCKTFSEYAAAAFKKLGLSEHLPSVQVLSELETRHSKAQAQMSAFFQVKLVLAPVIEGIILLDRLAFLLEQEEVTSAHLVQIFDPVTSPRCFALIARK